MQARSLLPRNLYIEMLIKVRVIQYARIHFCIIAPRRRRTNDSGSALGNALYKLAAVFKGIVATLITCTVHSAFALVPDAIFGGHSFYPVTSYPRLVAGCEKAILNSYGASK